MQRIIVTLAVLAMVGASSAFAVGEGKEGTSGAKFLNVGIGARAAAMADAYDPIASGPEAIFWNAAGLVNVENQGISISDNEWIADTRMVGAAYARRFGFGTVGFMVSSLMYGDMDVTTVEKPNGTGETFSAMDMAAGLAMGRRLTDRFSVGGTVKLLRLSFSGEVLKDVDPAMGVAFDVGTQYMTGFRTLRMAIALQNLGPELQYGGTYEELQRDRVEKQLEEYDNFSLPVVVRLGVAYDPLENMTLVVNAAHPNDGDETIDFGGEWWLVKTVAVRAGYKLNYDEAGFAGGVGFKFGGLRPDLSYTDMGRLEQALKLTLNYDF